MGQNRRFSTSRTFELLRSPEAVAYSANIRIPSLSPQEAGGLLRLAEMQLIAVALLAACLEVAVSPVESGKVFVRRRENTAAKS